MLPNPDLGNLHEIENHMRAANSTPGGREALAKFILAQKYIPLLIPLVDMAEDLESVSDLHRLCSIMKMLILLNDTSIIEYVVHDDIILGVVGALECTYRTRQTTYKPTNNSFRRPRFPATQGEPQTVSRR
jgi:protein phosphatase-4 regulatory subunit 3